MIKKLASESPGLAAAALQANASQEDINRLAALVQISKIHNNLIAMPQNEAYAKYQSYSKDTQKTLSELYSPKYSQEDKGFFGNTLRGIVNIAKSSVHYGGSSTADILKQVFSPNPVLRAGVEIGKYGLSAATSETNPVGGFLSDLMRPAKKLIKQPLQAQVLYEQQTNNNLLEDWKNVGRVWGQGIQELLPGGQDITTNYQGGGWKKYWAEASDSEAVFQPEAVAAIESEIDPSIAYLARTLSSGKDLVGEFDNYKNDPGITSLVALWTGGDEETEKQIASAVSRYEKAKISPGREFARGVVSLFPYKAEKAILGDGPARAFFTAISAPIDFGVTFGLDPLIIAGKARQAALIGKYSILKNGATSESFAQAVEKLPKVQKYFDEAGKLIKTYKSGKPEESALAYTMLRNRFRELNPDLIDDMAKFGVKDAKSTVNFFQGQIDITALLSGSSMIAKVPLLPRYTVVDSVTNAFKNVANKMLGTLNYRALNIPAEAEDLAKVVSENPIFWAEKVGVTETFAIGPDGKQIALYTQRDKSVAARIDKFVRSFEIAPKQERLISVSDGSSADKIFAMARAGGMDKTSASRFRTYWISANEGERLIVLKALLKTIGRGMGLEYSTVGRKLLAGIDELSTELYSVSQSTVNLGDINKSARLASGANISSPSGIRKTVQDTERAVTAEGKAGRVNASIVAEMSRLTAERKALAAAKKELKLQAKTGIDVTDKLETIDTQLNIIGAQWNKLNKARLSVKGAITEGDIPSDVIKFNAAEIDGAQRAIRVYQLESARLLPNFNEWREAAARSGVANKVAGGISNNEAAQAITDVWSFGNLYPRLGIRTSVEETGTHILVNGAEGFSLWLKGREMSRAIRLNQAPGVKNRIAKSKGYLKEVETTNLGVLYNSLYKILKKTKTKEELIALSNDPEKLAEAVTQSVLTNRFRPSFLNTRFGSKVADWAGDFVRFDGRPMMEDILGSSYRGDMRLSNVEARSKALSQYGPSISLNPNIAEALKGMKFKDEFTQIESSSEGFLVNWLLELNNTVGKRNGMFGNIVLWNAHKSEDEVVAKLVEYIQGDGAELANRFAIFKQVGAQNFAERIYSDATYALRDSSGRLNIKLVNAIRDKKGMDNFTLDDLAKFDIKYARPDSILGKELIPISQGDAPSLIRRIMDNGYGWVGKQIALLDREPITYGNYIMYRGELENYQKTLKAGMIRDGATPELADSMSRMAAHDLALTSARNRTLAFVDNADIRTNLAASLKTFGRYYRATEDFWRRLGRITTKSPEAIVRLAILNQTFEDSGFVHTDDKGELYFTYPGGDILNDALNASLWKMLGISIEQPLPVTYGGYVKMLTPSLDPQSAAPGLGGPLASVLVAAFEQLPFVGDFIKKYETTITGGFNPDQPLWRKILPAQILRILDIGIGGDANVDARFSAIVKSMRMLQSIGLGPTKPSEIDKFLQDSTIQAINQQFGKVVFGTMAPASIQTFENQTLPKELIRSGAFTWNSEFVKFLNRYPNDPLAYSKALMDFAKIYPSKLVFTVSPTTAGTEANFQKSFEAAEFVKKNDKLFLEHKQGAAFFIPITGASDIQSYQYLKSNGFVKNKQIEDYLVQVATAEARKQYYAVSDNWNSKIAGSNDPDYKKYCRFKLQEQQQQLKKIFPLLPLALSGGDVVKTQNALDDLREVILTNKAPDKKLAKTFMSMITMYDDYKKKTEALGNSRNDSNYKKFLKDDTKDKLVTISDKNPSAQAVYWTLLEPLIGD